ncbi:uncharacterized protein FRV6_13831 [Fusarium oxysporum]|uniref:Uncharacterized protein n=1 Tax=Fusarium oxysporum TaxID=5507 RepID=A0A2H3TM33_FUSOX|nr:uncharacterized protein FRV6_13831 [Fusarium oxysporum]
MSHTHNVLHVAKRAPNLKKHFGAAKRPGDAPQARQSLGAKGQALM